MHAEPSQPSSRKSYVYRYFDTVGTLLYVGKSDNVEKRTQEHIDQRHPFMKLRDPSRDATPEEYPNADEARLGEAIAILIERPLFNYPPNAKHLRTLARNAAMREEDALQADLTRRLALAETRAAAAEEAADQVAEHRARIGDLEAELAAAKQEAEQLRVVAEAFADVLARRPHGPRSFDRHSLPVSPGVAPDDSAQAAAQSELLVVGAEKPHPDRDPRARVIAQSDDFEVQDDDALRAERLAIQTRTGISIRPVTREDPAMWRICVNDHAPISPAPSLSHEGQRLNPWVEFARWLAPQLKTPEVHVVYIDSESVHDGAFIRIAADGDYRAWSMRLNGPWRITQGTQCSYERMYKYGVAPDWDELDQTIERLRRGEPVEPDDYTHHFVIRRRLTALPTQ